MTSDKSERALAATLATLYAPNTALSYLQTILAMRPDLKDDDNKDIQTALARDVARTRKARVVPPLAALKKRIRSLHPNVKAAVIFQLVTASRHADLANMKVTHVWEWSEPGWLAIRLALPTWKSDRKGVRFAAKVIAWPKEHAAAVRSITNKPPSYERVREALKGLATPHDIRRLGMTTAAAYAETPEHVLWLTQHAEAIRTTAHLRRYVTPTLNDPMAKVQLHLSRSIWKSYIES